MSSVINLNDLFPLSDSGSRGPLPKQKTTIDLCLDPKGPDLVAYYGGYGCLRGDTKIQTGRGLIPIEDVKPLDFIKSSNGDYVQVAGSFPKGKDRLYRVSHELGEFYASSAHLTYVSGHGYLSSFQLEIGHELNVASLPETNLELSRPVSQLSAESLSQISVNYLDHYLECYHQHGLLPQKAVDNVLKLLPLVIDALRYTPISERMDVLKELKQAGNHPDLLSSLLYKTRSMLLSDLREGVSEDYKASLVSAQISDADPESLLFLLKSLLHRTGVLQSYDREPSVSLKTSKILSVELMPTEEWYYDLEVLSTGHYLGEEGIIHHNSGKSMVLCIINIIWGILYGGEYIISRQFMPELRRTTMRLFKELLPKDLLIEERIADAQFRVKSLKGEALFHFVGLDEPGKLDSLTLDGVSIDEASQTSEEALLKLQGRLRGRKGLRKMLLVGNPKGHDFVYKYFIKQDCFNSFKDPVSKRIISVEEQKKKYKMIVAPSTENVHLPPNYVAQMLQTYSPERIQRDIMGSFDAFQGQIYTEFSRNTHVIKPFRVPDEWTKFIGADHGYNNPAAFIWLACDYDGNLYAYREFYEREWKIDEIVKGNKELAQSGIVDLSKGEHIEGIWIDPSTKADRGKDSDFTTYLEHLPKTWPLLPANNSVSTGIDRVKQYLRVNDKINKPKLFIFETCSNLIDELIKYRWDELTPGSEIKRNLKESPVKKDDHSVDALRYGIMSRPEIPVRADILSKERQHSTLLGSIQRELYDLKRGGATKDPWGESYGKDVRWDEN